MAATTKTTPRKQQPSPQKKAQMKAAVGLTVKKYGKTLELLART